MTCNLQIEFLATSLLKKSNYSRVLFTGQGRLALRESVCFVNFFSKGPWFETRHTPFFFSSMIYFAIMLDLESQKVSALKSRNLWRKTKLLLFRSSEWKGTWLEQIGPMTGGHKSYKAILLQQPCNLHTISYKTLTNSGEIAMSVIGQVKKTLWHTVRPPP